MHTGRAMRETDASQDPDAQFVFDGIDEATVGDFGLILDEAACDDVDSADFDGGTPSNTQSRLELATGLRVLPPSLKVMAMEPGVGSPDDPAVPSDVLLIDADKTVDAFPR